MSMWISRRRPHQWPYMVGAPAKLVRVRSNEERQKFDRNAVVYRELARRFRAGRSAI